MVVDDSFAIESGAAAGPCVKSEGSAPNTPTFEAGTFEPTGGAYSPLTLKLTRQDGTQRLSAIDATLPKGLFAKLAGIPYCSDAALAAAAAKTGREEQAGSSCAADLAGRQRQHRRRRRPDPVSTSRGPPSSPAPTKARH